jgi:predicted NUDIX family NTP pyrophosphohydrolase
MASRKSQSAGRLLFGGCATDLEVLLAHPGGPFWQNKDDGAWSIPKGLIGADEAPLAAAQREFAEETGYYPEGVFLPLGETRQPGGKVVQAWAIEGDWDPALIRSNTFEMEWPPRSGRHRNFPEIDRAAWFDVADARRKILMGQVIFVDRLLEGGPGSGHLGRRRSARDTQIAMLFGTTTALSVHGTICAAGRTTRKTAVVGLRRREAPHLEREGALDHCGPERG